MNSSVSPEIRRIVAERADGICEYCLISEDDSYYRHQIEHIVSLKHGGSSEPDNLALACVFCNRYKGSDIASIAGGELVRFFNPRTDVWSDHFALNGVEIMALTTIGEATSRILQFNNVDQLTEREVLNRRGLYPNQAAISLIRIQ